jgi:hypothetical protein
MAGTGDFNGDGETDILWQNTVTGERAIWVMSGPNLVTAVMLPTVPTDWQIAN